MYLLDTNVLSATAPTKAQPEAALQDWIRRNSEQLFLSAVTIMEINHGATWLEHRGAAARAAALRLWVDLVCSHYADRILAVDQQIALRAGELITAARRQGFAIEAEDAMIGATADRHSLTLLTANVRHFAPTGIAYQDPFRQLPPEIGT